MTVKEIAFKHEDLAMKTWSLASTVVALNEALFQGGYAASTYEGAFYQLVLTAHDISCSTQALIDDLFAALRESEGGYE